jgi:hypothetical protein
MANLRNSILLLLRIPLLLALNCSIGFGSDWSEIDTGLDDTNIRVVAVDPINPALVYAGTPEGLFNSTNGGMVWSNVGLKKVRSLAIDFINPNTCTLEQKPAQESGGLALRCSRVRTEEQLGVTVEVRGTMISAYLYRNWLAETISEAEIGMSGSAYNSRGFKLVAQTIPRPSARL